jgi:hypothetical protein
MDALTHAIEAYLAQCATPFSDAFAVAAFGTIVATLPLAVHGGPGAADARESLHLAATQAGLAFGNSDVGPVHCLSETLGGKFGIPHGLANAVMLLPTLAYLGPFVESRLALLAKHALPDMVAKTDTNTAANMLAALRALHASLRIQIQITQERVALSPERLLLTALDAPDTRRDPDTVLQSVPQNVVVFTLDGAPVHVYLNAYTHLPTAVDYSGPLAHSSYWAFLGDVTLRTWYDSWWLAKDAIHFPMQRNIEGNGLPDQTLIIRKLQIDEALNDADLTIDANVRAQFHPDAKPADLEQRPLGDPSQPAKELEPGIVFIPGSWNVTLVKQDDGIVVLEAPISSGYSAQVIAEVHKRFPNQPIKAVVTTSDSWPHLAGIREYVADGIPIYALDLNEPILNRVIAGSRTSKPDALGRSPRKQQFDLVHDKKVLGQEPTVSKSIQFTAKPASGR